MKYAFLVLIFLFVNFVFCQELEDILEEESEPISQKTFGTFNGTRLLNGHSVETRQRGVLEFLISHRFGRVNSGFDQLFGLDDSNIRFGFEYAFNDKLTMAVGRSSFEKTFDAYGKYRIVQQRTGEKSFPLSITVLGSTALRTLKDYLPENEPSFTEKMTYTGQVMIASKINKNLSLQFAPTFIHFNKVAEFSDPHDMIVLGFGTRVKISKRVSINGEYYYNLNPFQSRDVKNSIALGIDIETGGHIFQIILGNSVSMIEKGFIAETTGNFFGGDIHLGFNISRAFQVKKAK
jgi:hypothetical protein